MKKYVFYFAIFVMPLFAILCGTAQQPTTSAPQTTSSVDATIPAAQLLQPEELVRILRSPTIEKPLILQVGSHVLYTEAHIPGSEYVGAAGQDSGLKVLVKRVKELKRDQFLVIYCGCCAWKKCPNIRPAYRQLQSLGFTHVKALYIGNNFGTDWVNKGYPTTSGM